MKKAKVSPQISTAGPHWPRRFQQVTPRPGLTAILPLPIKLQAPKLPIPKTGSQPISVAAETSGAGRCLLLTLAIVMGAAPGSLAAAIEIRAAAGGLILDGAITAYAGDGSQLDLAAAQAKVGAFVPLADARAIRLTPTAWLHLRLTHHGPVPLRC